MRMITGFIPPTSGDIQVGGISILENETGVKSKIGYLPENAPLYPDMTVRDFLGFAAEMRGVEREHIKSAIDRAIELCFLKKVRHQSIDTLSKGYRHRTCLAQALIHDPEVLILDEPTDGLDPNQKHEVRGLIKRMGQDKAIIFSTHILEEVEAACTRAIIIDQGRIIADGTPDQLRLKAPGAGTVILRVTGKTQNLREEIEGLKTVRAARVLDHVGESLALRIEPSGKTTPEEFTKSIYDLCVEKKLNVSELSVERGKLDDLFRSLTRSDT